MPAAPFRMGLIPPVFTYLGPTKGHIACASGIAWAPENVQVQAQPTEHQSKSCLPV